MSEATPRADLIEAIAWWRAGLPHARRLLSSSATNALCGSMDGPALVALSGIAESDSRYDVDALLTSLGEEQGLSVEPGPELTSVALHRLCLLVLRDELPGPALCHWVATTFGHGVEDPLLRSLAELDVLHGDAEERGHATGGLEEEIRALARRLSTR